MTIFTDKEAALQELRSDRMPSAAESYLGGRIPSDALLWRKLLAAEAEARRKLGVPLEPTQILPDEPSAAELETLAGKPYIVEPGYDMDADFFSQQSWGSLMLRQRPVIAIESIRFVYPSMGATFFDVPDTWIRLDKKYGQVQIVPGPGASSAPISIFSLQAVSSGSRVPHMIRARYTAGIDCNNPENFDVVDIIMQMAVLRVVQDSFTPQSGSISADGLSQSVSADMGKLQEGLDDRLDALKQKLLGPVWGVL